MRVSLTKAVLALAKQFGDDWTRTKMQFEVSVNDMGQVLLSPETSIPLHEAWLYRNPEALANVREANEQLRRGEPIEELPSLARYLDDDDDAAAAIRAPSEGRREHRASTSTKPARGTARR
jgi:hypothetical protein